MRSFITILLLVCATSITCAGPAQVIPTAPSPNLIRGYIVYLPLSSFLLTLPSSPEETSGKRVLDIVLNDLIAGLNVRPDLGVFNDFFVTSLSFDTGHLFNSLLSPWQLFSVELKSRFSQFFSVRVAARTNLFAVGEDVRFPGFEMKCTFQHDGYSAEGSSRIALEGVVAY